MSSIFFILILFSLFTNVSSLRLNSKSSSQNDFNVSSKVKLFFYAGVEGSGHHLMKAVTASLARNQKEHPFFSLPLISLPHAWGCGKKWNHDAIEDVVTQWKTLQPGSYILPQQASYPMCGVGNHSGRAHMFFPHIDWMKAAADQAGVTLHILYLYRPLADCLAADCLHRKFESCKEQTETLSNNARELLNQLKSFPKSDYKCFYYGDVDAMQNAVTETFGPEAEEILETIYAEHPPQGLREKEKGWSKLEAKLEPTNIEMKEACSGVAPISLSEFSAL